MEMALQQYELQTLERTHLRLQLQHAQEIAAVGQFTSGIVHDLNNILCGISGLSADILPIDRQRALQTIDEAARRAAELTRELLNLARRDGDLPFEVLDLHEVVSSSEGLLRASLEKRVSLTTELAPDLSKVWGHSGNLKRVIANLVINARDATKAGGRIVISASNREVTPEEAAGREGWRSGRYVRLSVSDNGTGIDPATRKRLFEPFFTTKGVGRGTGLGLALVSRFAEQHKGWIDLESEVGVGTTFGLFLPQAGTPAA
jgi:signal transduction histidine kinase